MKTLIFRTSRDLKSRFGRGIKIEFVKEGSIEDAISHFDGSRDFGNIFHNDEKGYYFSIDDNGEGNISDAEIENNIKNTWIDSDGLCFYTLKIDNLSVEEIKSVLEDGHWIAQEVLEANGYNYDDYQVAEFFKDVDRFLGEFPYDDYINDYYNVSDIEDENVSSRREFELNDKFYQEK